MSNNFLLESEPISWEVAKQLIHGYNNHEQKWTTEGKILSALRISVEKLMEVATGDNPSQVVKDVLIVFGHNDGSINTLRNPIPKIGFTTILIGVNENNDMIRNGDGNIQDFLDTCPNNCPNKVDEKDLHEW